MPYKKILILLLVIVVAVGSFYSCADATNYEDAPDKIDKTLLDRAVQRGEYLVQVIGCGDCHTPKTVTPHGVLVDSTRILSGYQAERPLPEYPEEMIRKGYVVVNDDNTATMGPWGTSFSANLTSDATGIGNWREEQFRNALTHGKYKGLEGARPLMPPMPWENFKKMNEADVRAIFYYLKSTRPVKNVVPAFQPAPIK